MSLRDRIIAADDIGKRLVHVPEWNVDVEVRTLSTGMRSRMLQSATTGDGGVDISRLYPMLVIATAFDPETGTPIFDDSPEDFELIQNKSAKAVEVVAKVAMEMSGMSVEEGVEPEGKDS